MLVQCLLLMLRQDLISTLYEEATLEDYFKALAASALQSWLSFSQQSPLVTFVLQGTIRGINFYLQIFLRLGPHYLGNSVSFHSKAIRMHKGNTLIELYMISSQYCVFKQVTLMLCDQNLAVNRYFMFCQDFTIRYTLLLAI